MIFKAMFIYLINMDIIRFKVHDQIIGQIPMKDISDILQACRKHNPYTYNSFLTVNEEYVTFTWTHNLPEIYDIPIRKFQMVLEQIVDTSPQTTFVVCDA